MHRTPSPKVAKALGVMAELSGKTLPKSTLDTIARDLARFEEGLVLAALERCRLEIPRFPTIAEVVCRIPDGRPLADEAWAMCPKDEYTSAVWTSEMAEAFGIARPLLLEGDEVGARMAFREAYSRILSAARAVGRPIRWIPTLGQDKAGQESVLRQAVEAGRITHQEAEALLPDGVRTFSRQQLLQISQQRALEGPQTERELNRMDPVEQLRKIRESIEKPVDPWEKAGEGSECS